uniref:Uncharacterized protein n=1 Tax=Knipowitschia caucasica TaxID=637954 RepID=A0AAV2LS33_KNICA
MKVFIGEVFLLSGRKFSSFWFSMWMCKECPETVIYEKPNIEIRLLCILKALCVYLNEAPEDLVKTYMDADVGAEKEFEKVVLGVYIVEHQHADASDSLEDFGIIIDGIAVLQDLKHIPTGWALLLGLIYCLDMNSRKGLGCTFEFIPKVLMEVDRRKLSNKVQILKNKLHEHI